MASPRYDKLAGKHILLIGGTSGIGFAVAGAILSSSPTARLTLSSSSQTKIDSAIQRLKDSFPSSIISGYSCDLSTPELEASIASLFTKTLSSNPTEKIEHIIITVGDPISQASVHDSTLASILAVGQVRFVALILIAKIRINYLILGLKSSITFIGVIIR